MKLDRNINSGPRNGKYALLKLRRYRQIEAWDGGEGEALDRQAVLDAIALLERAKIIDWGDSQDSEFFVIRLKDRYAQAGLRSYATAAVLDENDEYANEVFDMANRAGPHHPNCKAPD